MTGVYDLGGWWLPTIMVHDTPAPQGSKRHVGKGIVIESSPKVRPWREAVKAATLEAVEPHAAILPLETALRVEITFTLRRPKTARRADLYPAKRPDIDKLERSTLDALTAAGVWVDDSQVVQLVSEKTYPAGSTAGTSVNALATPGAVIRVGPMPGTAR